MDPTLEIHVEARDGGIVRLTMYGEPDQRCEIHLDTLFPRMERELRDWMRNEAVGLHGHCIDSHEGTPVDIHAAFRCPTSGFRNRWTARITRSPGPGRREKPPPGGVF